MGNLTEDIRTDLTKIFSERNEVVSEDDNQSFDVLVTRTQSEVIEVIASSPEEAKRNAHVMVKKDEVYFQGEGEIRVEMYDDEFSSDLYGIDNKQ